MYSRFQFTFSRLYKSCTIVNLQLTFSRLYHGCSVANLCYNFRGLTSEEAQLQYILITQQLEGYGDEYYPAKVCSH